MLITHNALEFAFTPGRVTILGESDGNRLRRIYTDGRPHPDDPDPTFHGHSIGHWESDTLVVDTVAVHPESYIAVGEALGVANNGDMHIVERIHLQGADILHDDLEIDAPHVLTAPWKTTRIFLRQRAQKYDIVEGVCIEGEYSERVDENGDAVFVPMPHQPGGDWLLETTSPSVLVRLGWSRTGLKPGDRVRAQINPSRDPEQHGGTLSTVTLMETGKIFGTNNREQERPNLE